MIEGVLTNDAFTQYDRLRQGIYVPEQRCQTHFRATYHPLKSQASVLSTGRGGGIGARMVRSGAGNLSDSVECNACANSYSATPSGLIIILTVKSSAGPNWSPPRPAGRIRP